jgi:hypothetical protein
LYFLGFLAICGGIFSCSAQVMKGHGGYVSMACAVVAFLTQSKTPRRNSLHGLLQGDMMSGAGARRNSQMHISHRRGPAHHHSRF